MRMFSLKISLALGVLLLAGCESRNTGAAGQTSSTASREYAKRNVERVVSNPFPKAPELRLFVETDLDEKSGRPIFHRKDGLALTPAQRKTFEDSLRIEAAPEEMAACFIPHHFFRYFDAKGKQIGEVSVCFCCEGVSASGSDQLETANGEILGANYADLKSLVASLGEPTDVPCD